MPSNVEPYHKHTFINKKPQLDYGNYYTNNILTKVMLADGTTLIGDQIP